jgi:outer membrane protein TolC
MSRTVSLLAASLVLTASSAAIAQPAPPPVTPPAPAAPATESLDSRLKQLIGRSGGLTSDEVGRKAQSTSYDVMARQKDVQAAAASVDQALVAYIPRLGLTGRYTRLSPLESTPLGGSASGSQVGTQSPSGTVITSVSPTSPLIALPAFSFPIILDNYLLQATVTVPISDYLLKTSQSYASAERTQKGAELNERAQRLKTSADARSTYYSWVRARLSVVVSEQALAQADGHLKDAKSAFQVGTVSKADVLRVESQLASAELLLLRAKNLSDLLEHQVRVAMHDPMSTRYEIGEDVTGEMAPIGSIESLNDLVSEAMDKRLEIRALDETAWSLKEQAKAARASNYPVVSGFGDLIYANPNTRIIPQEQTFKATWDVGLQVTWSPNDIGTGTALGKNLDARAASIEAQKAALSDGLRVEVMQQWQAYREAEASIATTQRGLTSAEEGYRVRKELFTHGRATSVELTDAETDLTRARLEAINARVDLRIAKVKLIHALGRDVAAAK